MKEFIFRFLGTFQICVDATPVTDFHSDKVRALLAYLVLEPYEHTRATLAALLWPEIGDRHARANLRNTLHRLRQALDAVAPGSSDHLLTVSRQTIGFNLEQATVDAHDFLSTVRMTQAASAADHDQLEAATALYRGELLAGFGVADAPAFEEWLLLRREVLHQQALVAMDMLTAAYETAGTYERAYTVASRLLTLNPFREETHRQIMRLLAHMGQPDRALEQLERLRQLLHQEMGVDPADETLTLARQISAGAFGQGQDDKMTGGQELVLSLPKDDSSSGGSPLGAVILSSSHPLTPSAALDLSEVPMPGTFFGRIQERSQIERWLVQERCQVVALLGIGGMGKTTLIAQSIYDITERMERAFDAVIWRSLVNTPPLGELLPPLLQTLSHQRLTQIPEQVDELLRLLLGYLRERRVLLVLDNIESILEPGAAGAYRPGYEPYGQLLQQMATMTHRSQLVLTSRERPRGYARLERDGYLVKSLFLTGLDNEAGHQLFLQRGVLGDDEDETLLIARYSGNPLALKLVADTVDEIFDGDIAEFLADDTLIFDDIRIVLDQHFARLNALEQQLLFWLAIERETTPLATLRGNLLKPPPQRVLLETLRTLQRHALVERQEDGFSLQNVVAEYLTERLIEIIVQEIVEEKPTQLHAHALLKTSAKEYIRDSQRRLFLEPIGTRLLKVLGHQELTKRLQRMLDALRNDAGVKPSYLGGNMLNLLLKIENSVHGYDFSRIAIRQADLRRVTLQNIDFTAADFSDVLFTDEFGFLFSIAVSPNGELLAAATDSGEIRLWRWSDRQLIAVLEGHINRALSVVFSPNGKLLVSSGMDQTVHIWDVEKRTGVHILRGHTGAVRNVAISPDGLLLASCSQDHTVRIWSLQQGKLLTTLQGHSDWVNSVAFHPSRPIIASGGYDQTVCLWDLHNLNNSGSGVIEPSRVLHGHDHTVTATAFSPDGLLLATADSDGLLALWSVMDAQKLTTLQGHSGWVRGLAFSPDRSVLASGSTDRIVRLWDVAQREVRDTFYHSGEIWSLAFHPDGHALVCGALNGAISIWALQGRGQSHHLATLYGNIAAIGAVAFSSDGKLLAAADESKNWVRIWQDEASVNKWRSIRLLIGHTHMIRALAFSPDGKYLASAGEDQTVRIWDAADGSCSAVLRGHTAGLYSVAFAPDGRLLASAGDDSAIRLWRIAESGTGQLHQILHGHTGVVYQLAFSPRTKLLASVSDDHTLRLWDLTTGETIATMEGRQDYWSVAFDPTGETLACGGRERVIHLRHMGAERRGQILRTLQGHGGNISGLAFSPSGNALVSGSEDGNVIVWDPDTGSELHRMQGNGHSVESVAFHRNGKIFASGSFDGSVRIWQLHDGTLLANLRPPAPYEGMNITGVTGISEAQRASLKALGAVERDGPSAEIASGVR